MTNEWDPRTPGPRAVTQVEGEAIDTVAGAAALLWETYMDPTWYQDVCGREKPAWKDLSPGDQKVFKEQAERLLNVADIFRRLG